jgi:hypothetical protein
METTKSVASAAGAPGAGRPTPAAAAAPLRSARVTWAALSAVSGIRRRRPIIQPSSAALPFPPPHAAAARASGSMTRTTRALARLMVVP